MQGGISLVPVGAWARMLGARRAAEIKVAARLNIILEVRNVNKGCGELWSGLRHESSNRELVPLFILHSG
jgi:hypothetical protein